VNLWIDALSCTSTEPSLLSFRQVCHEAYIRLQMVFQTKSFFDPSEKLGLGWYKFVLSAVSSHSESSSDFLSPADWAVEESRDSAERRDENKPGFPCVDSFSE